MFFLVKIDGWFCDLVYCIKSNCFVVLVVVKVFNLIVVYFVDKLYWIMKRMWEVVNSWFDSVNFFFGLLLFELFIVILVLVFINCFKLWFKVCIS